MLLNELSWWQDKMQKYEVLLRAQLDGAVGALLEKHQEFPNQHMPCDMQEEKQVSMLDPPITNPN